MKNRNLPKIDREWTERIDQGTSRRFTIETVLNDKSTMEEQGDALR